MYKKYRDYVMTRVDRRTALEQLAEEACELAQAALKVIRAEGLSENPTDICKSYALNNLEEELTDIEICRLIIFGKEPRSACENSIKWKRWAERLGYKE